MHTVTLSKEALAVIIGAIDFTKEKMEKSVKENYMDLDEIAACSRMLVRIEAAKKELWGK